MTEKTLALGTQRRRLVASAIIAVTLSFGLAALPSGCGSDKGAALVIGATEAGPSGPGSQVDARESDSPSDGAPADGDVSDASSDVESIEADAGDSCPDGGADAGTVDCTGLCGPIKDKCTGVITQCGGCQSVDGQPRVCDLAAHVCIVPKTTCADFGAECGTVKNSCGTYLDCPDTASKGCPDGKECDPNTNKCRACEPVTCADLGKECGFAWLGCGEDTPANYTDCGSCTAGDGGAPRVCNSVFNVCEPQCTPKSATELCNEAKTKRGVECGVVSNGCGGVVNCDAVPGFGCSNGENCGVRGIANRCDPPVTPDECKAIGRNCGTITSACSGKPLSCGQCPQGEVCNANGVCGPPCAAKTCADFTQYECGTFSDGCGGSLTCGACASGVCDNTTNTCCAASTCTTSYSGKCGSALPNGCGKNVLTCACSVGSSCTADGGAAPAPPTSTPGMCCAPRTASYYASAKKCGTKLSNGCGAFTVDAPCGANQECVNNANGSPGLAPPPGVEGTCCTRTDSCNLAANTCGPVQNSCRPAGTTYTCSKCVAPATCNVNTCCIGAPTCTGGGGENAECNITKQPVDLNCGSPRTCNCTGGRTCLCGGVPCANANSGPGVCKSPLTCASAPYGGKCGVGLPNGVGGSLSCGCPTGQVCSTSTPGQVGTCSCNNPTNAPYTCLNVPNGPSKAGGDACGTFSNGCGGTLNCGCPAGTVCNQTPNPNVCCSPAVCPAPGLGSACGTITNGCTSVTCGCPSGPANANFQCTAGTCTCVKDTCRGRTGPQPDLCGGTLSCGG